MLFQNALKGKQMVFLVRILKILLKALKFLFLLMRESKFLWAQKIKINIFSAFK